jgi:hypothetical protein
VPFIPCTVCKSTCASTNHIWQSVDIIKAHEAVATTTTLTRVISNDCSNVSKFKFWVGRTDETNENYSQPDKKKLVRVGPRRRCHLVIIYRSVVGGSPDVSFTLYVQVCMCLSGGVSTCSDKSTSALRGDALASSVRSSSPVQRIFQVLTFLSNCYCTFILEHEACCCRPFPYRWSFCFHRSSPCVHRS